MSHILTLVDTDPRNFKPFENWVNSLNYGSRPFLREVRLFDIAIQEVHKEKFLADLKHYYKSKLVGMSELKTQLIQKAIQIPPRMIGMKPIDMNKIEATPTKWFKPVKFPYGVTHGLYLFPIGSYPDRIDERGHMEI